VARVSARFSKSMASRRFRPNQEKVRSTTSGVACHMIANVAAHQLIKREAIYTGQRGSGGYPGPTRAAADAQGGGAADTAYPLKGPLAPPFTEPHAAGRLS
jgi:hypothetical protein